MRYHLFNLLLLLTLLNGSMVIALHVPRKVWADVVPDNSLLENSRVIRQDNTLRIEGGTQRGNNLFHSFQEFSVPTGEIADFRNADSIANIFARITGSSRSEIDGTIRASGTANLFFLNPNGILFGRNASLDIGGSFLATTANSFAFGEGLEFSATNPQAVPLLAISVPLGLQYGANSPGAITSQASLAVDAGHSLALLGGQVMLDNSRLTAPGGQVELGSALETGSVGLRSDGNLLGLNFPNTLPRSDIFLINGSVVNVMSNNGGGIEINARNLNVSGNSLIQAGIALGQGSIGSQSGVISLDATDAIHLVEASRIENEVNASAIGNSGNIIVDAGSLSLANGAQILSRTRGQGNAGDIAVQVRGNTLLSGISSDGRFPSGISSRAVEQSIGNSGDIRVSTRNLIIENGAFLNANIDGIGNAGTIAINAYDNVSIAGRNGRFYSGVFNEVGTNAQGNGGDIRITTGSISVTDSAALEASLIGRGSASDIVINARDRVLFNAGGAYSEIEPRAVGTGGDIWISTNSLLLSDNSRLEAGNQGQGSVGNISINARGSASFDNSFAFNTVETGAVGNGGDININAVSLSLTNGAALLSRTFGRGDAGNVIISARDRVSFNASSIFSNVEQAAVGNGGNIRISADSLSLTDGAQLFATTAGQGNAGSVSINARNQVSLNFGDIFSDIEETAVGNGGNVSITAGSLALTDGAQIITTAAGRGDAGSVTINTRNRVLLMGTSRNGEFGSGIFSDIEETAVGDGGDIRITTNSFLLSNGANLLSSTAGQGNAGNINIQADNSVFLRGGNEDFYTNISSAVDETGRGRAGDITITTDSLSIVNGARLLTSTSGQGQAGDIIINARDQFSLDGTDTDGVISLASSRVNETGRGQAGNIHITTGSFSLSNQAQLQSLTFGKGDAGDVIINAHDAISIDGTANTIFRSSIFSSVENTGRGQAGNIRISTDSLALTNGANLTTRSLGQGNAGNIDIRANSVYLDRSRISAETTSRNGGNITLREVARLLMRNGSLISTEAGTAQRGGGGNGGDIAIGNGLIVAAPLENNDIQANAFDGRGGNIEITTQGIFGTQFREAQTPASDITASSRFGVSGTVQIDSPTVDPSQGLIELPANVVDASALIAQTCPTVGTTDNELSEFVITGRGGLPPSPSDPRDEDAVLTDWATLEDSHPRLMEANAGDRNAEKRESQADEQVEPIVEAQGWMRDKNGNVLLVAQAPTMASQVTTVSSNQCNQSASVHP